MRSLVRCSLAIDALNRHVANATAWLLVVMILIGGYNALARTFEDDVSIRLTSNALLEAQWYLFGLVFLLGAAHTLRRDAHVRVDVIYGGLPRRGKYWTDLIGGLLLLLPFCAFAVVISLPFVIESVRGLEDSNDPGGLPRWPLKIFVPLGFLLLLLQGLSEVVKRIALLRGWSERDVGLVAEDTRR